MRIADLEQAAADERAWQQAETADAAPAYRDYLTAFPAGRSVTEAETALARLDRQAAAEDRAWETAEGSDTAEGYRAFVEAHPESDRAIEAARRLRNLENQAAEDAAWSEAETADSVEAYRAFLSAYPDSPRASLAEERIADRETLAQRERDELERAQQELLDELAEAARSSVDAVQVEPQVTEAALGLSVDDRRAVQRGLTALGFSAGTPDGVLGDNSRDAIQAFQRDRGDTATGYLTQAQWWTLRDAAAIEPEPEAVETVATPAPPVTAPPTPAAIDFGLVARLNGPWTDAGAPGCTPTLIFSLVNRAGSVRWQDANGTQSATVDVEAAGDGLVTLEMAGVGPVDIRITPTGVTFRGRSYRRC